MQFETVYDAHAPEVLRVATRILGDPQQAEDVAHEVFLRLWRRPESFDPSRGDLGGFLRGAARNGAIDAWRRNGSARRTRERLEHDVAGARPAEDVAALAERGDAAANVRAAVRRLPESQREVVALAYWGGLSASEISRDSGVPLGTVKSRMRMALTRLRAEIAGPDVPLSPA
jgi:RNA polymerase sigma-70 factor, ECF subfamily